MYILVLFGIKSHNKTCKMNHWILPANPKTYRHIEAFEKWGYIDWVQKNKFEVGDIVYIYNARPNCKIICKTIVEQVDLTTDNKTADSEFWNDKEAEKQSLALGRFCRLRQLCVNPNNVLSIHFLRELGITGFQGARRITEHIAAIFNLELKAENDSIDIDETYPEGVKIMSFVNRYERNPIARKRCLEHYNSYKCQICQFDFEKSYGEIGKEFIHIHHITPISEIGEEYEVDPINDLIPVCPNCHAMLHKKTTNGRCLSISDLKEIIKVK